MKVRIAIALALLVAALAAAGCVREPLPEGWKIETGQSGDTGSASSTGSVHDSTRIVELDGATDADVTLSIGAGEMHVGSSDSSALAEARFEYRDKALRPEVAYNVSGSTGQLEIAQPDVRYKFGVSDPNSWDVLLAKGVPMKLAVHMGAGSSRLDLSDLDVRDLTMRLGAGETTVDLTGPRTENVAGDIQAGIGQLIIELPSDVGVRVLGRNEGIGSFEADGFKVDGDAYVNDAYGKTPATIELEVTRGVGEVKLELR